MMTGADILRWLETENYSVRRVGTDRLAISPEPTPEIVERVRARKADIIACLAEFELPPELAHAYVLHSGAKNPEYSVCLRCGYPPPLHGEDPLESAITVDDANAAALLAVKAAVENAAVRATKRKATH